MEFETFRIDIYGLEVQYFRYRYDELKFNLILHINVLIIRYFNRNTINFEFGHDITTLIMAIFEKVDYIEIELAPIRVKILCLIKLCYINAIMNFLQKRILFCQTA